MVKDQQVRRLFTLLQTENSQAVAAAQAGMDVKTACKYQQLGRLPSEVKVTHRCQTLSRRDFRRAAPRSLSRRRTRPFDPNSLTLSFPLPARYDRVGPSIDDLTSRVRSGGTG